MSFADEQSFDPDFAAPSEWAAMYRAHGVQVVPARYPMRDRNDKRPKLSEWEDFQNELMAQTTFDQLFPPTSKPNMGAITGACSGRLLVIDLDEYKSTESTEWWHDLTFGIDPETWQQRTGGGGRQIFFRLPDDAPVIGNCRTSIGIDIRCQGGFAMLPPSVHMSGERYAWIPGFAPWEVECDIASPKIIAAVLELFSEFGPMASGGAQRTANPETDKDAFGHDIDGREAKMTRMVWGRLVDLYRKSPILPGIAELENEKLDLFKIYERTTRTRQKGVTNSVGLENEGRGWSAFSEHWRRALKKWDTDIAKAARAERAERPREPGAGPEASGGEKPAGEAPGASYGAAGEAPRMILSAAEFVAGFTPPKYLVDGMIQRGYLYSLTAKTGHGKTAVTMFLAQAVARGTKIRGYDVTQGSVLILAGENPDDVRARFLVLADKHGFDIAKAPIHFIAGIVDVEAELPRIRAEAAAIPNLMLVIVDTAAAYFKGDDANSNAQQGAYARVLRELTFLPNKPAGVINCHPVKNASRDNLVPVGGGAFLNEVDGNLTLWSETEKQTILHWQGKFRGPEFEPVTFKIETVHCEAVKDDLGRLMPSVVALPVSDFEQQEAAAEQESRENVVLAVIGGNKPMSVAEIAKKAGFVSPSGAPQKSTTQRLILNLRDAKLVHEVRGKWRITKAGKQELGWEDGDE